MLMRFRGGGVGHKSTREATNKLLTDRHRTNQSSDRRQTQIVEADGEEAEDEPPELHQHVHSNDNEPLLSEEEEDYGYDDPMNQHIVLSDLEENSDDDGEWSDVDDDALGPEDGNEGAEDIEGILGYAEL
ncbi:hypothetical protein C0991_001091 [Blastosporella zonata]|nr:hypothetical protein C0991_001091 [Blastosporella zonata]